MKIPLQTDAYSDLKLESFQVMKIEYESVFSFKFISSVILRANRNDYAFFA